MVFVVCTLASGKRSNYSSCRSIRPRRCLAAEPWRALSIRRRRGSFASPRVCSPPGSSWWQPYPGVRRWASSLDTLVLPLLHSRDHVNVPAVAAAMGPRDILLPAAFGTLAAARRGPPARLANGCRLGRCEPLSVRLPRSTSTEVGIGMGVRRMPAERDPPLVTPGGIQPWLRAGGPGSLVPDRAGGITTPDFLS